MRKALALFLFAALIFTPSTFASLVIYPPPYPVIETAQKAVIWYENGVETLILSTTFRGSAKDFGWLIPVPQKPQVDRASDEIYTALDDLTRPKYEVNRGPLELPLGISGLEETPGAPPAPTVIETKSVDIFDVTTIEAKDDKGLKDWLSKNGYPYPQNRDHIIKSYIDEGWFFVVVKVNSGVLGYAQQALRDGHATPLKIVFSSEQIVYPIKLSGPGLATSQDGGAKVAAFSFEQGVEGFYGSFTQSSQPTSAPGVTRNFPRVSLNLDQKNSYHGSFSLKATTINPELAQNIFAQASISNLRPGKIYTLSAWAKSINPKNGRAYVAIYGTTKDQSDSKNLAELSNWQKFTLNFVAPSAYVTIQLVGDNFSEGETINWDAVQVEEGDKASEFAEEILPTSQATQKNVYPQAVDQVTVLLYVFSDRKKELPGFTTSYASWVSEKTIEKLAFTPDGKNPWIDAKGKMYLTKLHRQMKPSEMTTDLILRDAQNNDPVNAESFPEVSTVRFFAVIILVLVAEVGGIVGFIVYRRRKTSVQSST